MERVRIVKFYPFEVPYKRGRLLAYFDILLYGEILIRNVKLIRNVYGGMFVAMPSFQVKDRNIPVVEILSKELSEEIRRKLVDFYKEKFAELKNEENS
ncbi:septation protein SpoVG family protein [Aquifex sp.]